MALAVMHHRFRKLHVGGKITRWFDPKPLEGGVIRLHRLFWARLVVHDPAQHLDEGERMFGQVNLAAKQRHAAPRTSARRQSS